MAPNELPRGAWDLIEKKALAACRRQGGGVVRTRDDGRTDDTVSHCFQAAPPFLILGEDEQ